jgi:hypothetical protein
MKLSKISITTVVLILVSVFLFRQARAEGFQYRKYAGEFMDIGVGARAQALGGAYTAISGDITCSYYNPAGLNDLDVTQLAFMHTQQMIASVNYDFLAAGYRQNENRSLAVSLIRLGIDNIPDSREAQILVNGDPNNWRIDYDKVKQFNAADYILTFSIAQQMRQNWTLGANVKLIRRNLAEHSANGLGFDLGIQRKLYSNLQVGANIRNVTSTLVAWDTGEKELVKPSLYLGGTYLLSIHKLNSSFQPVVDMIFRGENRQETARANVGIISFDYAAGMEYSYQRTLFLRGGVDEIGRLTLGVGIKIPHLNIDYAFTRYDSEIGNSQRIGLLVSL